MRFEVNQEGYVYKICRNLNGREVVTHLNPLTNLLEDDTHGPLFVLYLPSVLSEVKAEHLPVVNKEFERFGFAPFSSVDELKAVLPRFSTKYPLSVMTLVQVVKKDAQEKGYPKSFKLPRFKSELVEEGFLAIVKEFKEKGFNVKPKSITTVKGLSFVSTPQECSPERYYKLSVFLTDPRFKKQDFYVKLDEDQAFYDLPTSESAILSIKEVLKDRPLNPFVPFFTPILGEEEAKNVFSNFNVPLLLTDVFEVLF